MMTVYHSSCSNGGKVLNFKIVDSGGQEFYITPRRKFPSIRALLDTYKTTPLKSKKHADCKIFLLNPIPVDRKLEERHKNVLENKTKEKGMCLYWATWSDL